MSIDERTANEALREALQALTRADELAERAGYGSVILCALDEALRAARYALDTAEGRT